MNLLATYLLAEAEAQHIDIRYVSVKQARILGERYGVDITTVVKWVKSLIADNELKRKQMPVIDDAQLFDLQQSLADGSLGQTVSMTTKELRVDELMPTQKNIYLDKSLDLLDRVKEVLQDSQFVVSLDNYIIDGHHRWLAGMIADPECIVKVKQCNLLINDLLPLMQAYTDKQGLERKD